jgi:hypothetical protein
MPPPIQFGHADDESSRARLAEAIREWDPGLDLVAARDDPRIYEPDGTLYAVGLADETSLLARYKVHEFCRGDMIVVPRSVAIEAEEPGAHYVAIRHDGPPPYHFRERFIQTWGYEHRPASREDLIWSVDEVIPEDDARFRVPYRRSRVGDPARGSTRLDLHLLVGLEGKATVADASRAVSYDVGPGDLALIRIGVDYWIEGKGVVGRLILMVESAHEARLAEAVGGPSDGPSPEFRPGG